MLMTYSVDLAKQGNFAAPVAATLVCECDADYNKKVNITVVLRNNAAHRGVQHATLEVQSPLFRLLQCACFIRCVLCAVLPQDMSIYFVAIQPGSVVERHVHWLR